MKEAKQKKKPAYSMGSDVLFLLKTAWKTTPKLFFWYPVSMLLELGMPAIAMILPSRAIALLQVRASFTTLFWEITCWSLGLLLCGAGYVGLTRFTDFAYLTFPRTKMSRMGCLKKITCGQK